MRSWAEEWISIIISFARDSNANIGLIIVDKRIGVNGLTKNQLVCDSISIPILKNLEEKSAFWSAPCNYEDVIKMKVPSA